MELQKVSVLYFARIFQNVLGIFSILADTEPQEIELMIQDLFSVQFEHNLEISPWSQNIEVGV